MLLSSHLLNEIERVADDIIVIGSGRIVAQGTKDELLKGAGTVVRATDGEALVAALARRGSSFTAPEAGGLRWRPSPAAVGAAAARQASSSSSCAVPTAGASRRCSSSLTAADAREEVAA